MSVTVLVQSARGFNLNTHTHAHAHAHTQSCGCSVGEDSPLSDKKQLAKVC